MSRLLDWLVVPTRVDINQTGNPHKPYQSSCPRGDHRGRPATTMREAREQQLKHWTRDHYQLNSNPDGGWGSGWGSGLDY